MFLKFEFLNRMLTQDLDKQTTQSSALNSPEYFKLVLSYTFGSKIKMIFKYRRKVKINKI